MREPIENSQQRAGIVAALLFWVGTALAGDDWPQFRGPTRDGRSSETGLLREWPERGPEILWRVELGGGYSGIAVAGGIAFTLSSETGGEHLLALDAATGRERWRFRTGRNRPDEQGGGPRSTPTVAGDLVFATSAFGTLHAVETATGQPRWQVDLVRELGANIPEWGVSSSPLADGDRLYVELGGGKDKAIVALDQPTGKSIWQGGSDSAGYASPLIVDIGGLRQLLSFGATAINALRPETGHQLWRIPWPTTFGANAAMPVFAPPDMLLFSSGYDMGAMVIRMRLDGRQLSMDELWRNRNLRNRFSSSVVVEGFIYGFDEDTLKCLEVATGRVRWRVRRSHGSLTFVDGHLLVLDGSGRLFLAEASPEAWRMMGRAAILRGSTWNQPALANGVFFARSREQMVAVRVGAPIAPGRAATEEN